MMYVVLVPIIKDKPVKISDKDNSRSIAFGSIMLKVIEIILLDRLSDALCSLRCLRPFSVLRLRSCADTLDIIILHQPGSLAFDHLYSCEAALAVCGSQTVIVQYLRIGLTRVL